ncbi:MAG: DUF4239 domain-containing protein [Actinobacteria bacterium]|uniref:Unannotated protein n=1 Tax=freshwater metagenome TaxID=449393 RepID=A0A6J7GV82_9ZZZZ|nr:DUF4239 domain-containing protein [Actinomycetota bacterium]
MVESLTPMQAFLLWPLWAQILVVVVPLTAATIVLTRVARRLPLSDRGDDNVATAIIRFAGAAFVFLGAFAIVTAWQSSNATPADIQKEFSSVTSLAQDTRAIDAPQAQALRDRLQSYAKEVRSMELANTPRIEVSLAAEDMVYQISDAAYVLAQTEYLSSDEVSSVYKDFDTFKQARNSRLAHSSELVPDAIMWVLLAMGTVMIVVIGLFPSGPRAIYKWMQSIGGLIVVVLVLGAVLVIQSGEASQAAYLRPIDVFVATYLDF